MLSFQTKLRLLHNFTFPKITSKEVFNNLVIMDQKSFHNDPNLPQLWYDKPTVKPLIEDTTAIVLGKIVKKLRQIAFVKFLKM